MPSSGVSTRWAVQWALDHTELLRELVVMVQKLDEGDRDIDAFTAAFAEWYPRDRAHLKDLGMRASRAHADHGRT